MPRVDGVRGIGISPDGTSLYAASELDDAFVTFKREATGPFPGPPNLPPTVQITSPVDGSSFNRTLNFAATASDDGGVERVEFWVDSLLKATDTTAPYEGTWTASETSATGPRVVRQGI